MLPVGSSLQFPFIIQKETPMRTGRLFDVAIAASLLSFLVAGCSEQTAPTPTLPEAPVQDEAALGERGEELTLDIKPHAISTDFSKLNDLPHGIDGDSRVVFVAEPVSARVAIIDRFTGKELGSLPAPPGGFILPFSLRVPSEGHLVVLDAGGFPNPSVPSVARVYDYDYSHTHGHQGGVSATLTSTVRFDNLPVVFAEDVEVLPDGSKVVAESILGQLWLISPGGQISVGVGPRTFAPEDAIQPLAPCGIPTVQVDGVPFDLGGNFGPGVISLAQRGGYLYFGATCAGGVHRVPVPTLSDNTRTPDERAADITTVAPKVGDVDMLHGLAFNRWKPSDNHIYAADPIRLRVVRIDTNSGQREVLGDNTTLFNFPVSLQFLPPVLGVTPLVVSSDQEHRYAGVNAAIDHDMFLPPFRLTKVLVFP
jgi:hypothetical protein